MLHYKKHHSAVLASGGGEGQPKARIFSRRASKRLVAAGGKLGFSLLTRKHSLKGVARDRGGERRNIQPTAFRRGKTKGTLQGGFLKKQVQGC